MTKKIAYPKTASGVIALFVQAREDRIVWMSDNVPGVGIVERAGFWLSEKQVKWVRNMKGAAVHNAHGVTRITATDDPGEFGLFDWSVAVAPNGAGTLKLTRLN